MDKANLDEESSYFSESGSIFIPTEEGERDDVVDTTSLGGFYVKPIHGFKCTIENCKEIFNRKKDLELHIYQHTGERTVECLFEGCTKMYANRTSMIRHLKKNHPKDERIAQVLAKTPIERKYKCDYDGCDKEFLRKNSLDRHMFEHTGLKNLDCPIDGCDKLYVTMQSLQRHLKTTHLKTELVSCRAPNCKQQFQLYQDMQEHYRKSHINEKNQICTECNEGFRRKLDLKKHMYKHTNEYPYKCTECDKGFTDTQKLTKHMEWHTGKKCQYCEQTFKNWTELVRHQKNEHSSDPKCEECGKIFKTRAYLRRHLKTHLRQSEVPTFECPHENCTRSYKQYNNLRTHIKSAHEGIFKCTVDGCTKILSSKRRLLHHVKLHNEPNPKPLATRKKPTFTKPKMISKRISTASILVDFENPFEVEKEIVLGNGENIIIDDDVMSLSDAVLDVSDIEECQIKKSKIDSTAICGQEVRRKDYHSDSSSTSTQIQCH